MQQSWPALTTESLIVSLPGTEGRKERGERTNEQTILLLPHITLSLSFSFWEEKQVVGHARRKGKGQLNAMWQVPYFH